MSINTYPPSPLSDGVHIIFPGGELRNIYSLCQSEFQYPSKADERAATVVFQGSSLNFASIFCVDPYYSKYF